MGQLDHEYNKFTTAKQMSVILDSKLVAYSPMILIIVIGLSYERKVAKTYHPFYH